MTRRGWRAMTWVIVAWSALILAGIVVWSLSTATKSCGENLFDTTCANIEVNGRATVILGHAVGLIVVWIVGFVVLAAIWFMTRPKERTCPRCGENLVRGVTTCPTCGFDFTRGPSSAEAPAAAKVVPASIVATVPVVAAEPVVAAVPVVAALPPEGWYSDSERLGHKRWWDGAAWGMRDDEHPSLARGNTVVVAGVLDAVAATAVTTVETPVAVALEPAPVEPAPMEPAPEEPLPVVVAAAVEASPDPVPVVAAPPASEPASGAPAARFCGNCGAERRPDARFCTSCGTA